MSKFAAQSMRRFATLLVTQSMKNNAQLSMNNNVILSMKEFATLSKSKSVILFMSKYANLPSLAMVVDLEAVEVVVEVEQEADMVLQQPQLADVFQESSVTMCQDNNAQMFQDSNVRMYQDKFP